MEDVRFFYQQANRRYQARMAILRSAGGAKAQRTGQRAYSEGARAAFAERPNV